jgi:hypothetical protein
MAAEHQSKLWLAKRVTSPFGSRVSFVLVSMIHGVERRSIKVNESFLLLQVILLFLFTKPWTERHGSRAYASLPFSFSQSQCPIHQGWPIVTIDTSIFPQSNYTKGRRSLGSTLDVPTQKPTLRSLDREQMGTLVLVVGTVTFSANGLLQQHYRQGPLA